MSAPIYFETANEFRAWLHEHHTTATEVHVGYYKVGSKKDAMTWSDSVDQALCYGWIDGVRRSVDKDRYQIRFTPRKKSSIWSPVNLKKVEYLLGQGLMQEEGIAIYDLRQEGKSDFYAYTKEEVKFPPSYEAMFRANPKAWEYYNELAASYRRPSTNWVMSAKQETTQLRRLEQLIEESAAGTNQWKNNKYKK